MEDEEKAGIIRIKSELEAALVKLQEFRTRIKNVTVTGGREFNPGFHLAFDLENMLIVSECIARSGLAREESRGGHTREDFPKMDPKWRQINLVCAANTTVLISYPNIGEFTKVRSAVFCIHKLHYFRGSSRQTSTCNLAISIQ